MVTHEDEKCAELFGLATSIAIGDSRIRYGVTAQELIVYTFYDPNPYIENITEAFECWPFAEWEMGPERRIYYVSTGGSLFYQSVFGGTHTPVHARIFDPNRHGFESLTWLHAQLKALTLQVHPS